MKFTQRTLSFLGSMLLLISALLSATGCGQRAPAAGGASAALEPLTVSVANPQRQTLSRLTEQPARIEAFESAPIFVKIPGYVEKVHVERGQLVKKGDPLADLYVPEVEQEHIYKLGMVAQAKIDITLAERALEVAQANVRTSRSLVEESRYSLKRTEAVQSRWKSEATRMEALVRDKLIDPQSYDETLSQFRASAAARDEAEAKQKSAEAAATESQARCNKAQAEIQAARNRLELAKAEERRAAAMLNYAHVTAPFDGVVSARNVDRGHFLQPTSGPSSKAEPLFVVTAIDKVRVFLDVPESDAVFVKYGIKTGSTARIRVPSLNDREFTGIVAGSSWSLEPSQRTLRTEIDFDNVIDAANPDGLLRPGMYAQAVIEMEQANAWLIPSSAITMRDGQTYCFLLEDGRAVKTLIKIGAREGTKMPILKRQVAPTRPGEKSRWVDITGQEQFIIQSSGELSDGHEVRLS